MAGTTTDLFHEKTFRIMKHDDDDKFFTKLVSKETSRSAASFRVYYGDVSSSIPFTWETIPGTPKHISFENRDIPPLTPPPSHYTSSLKNKSCKKTTSRLSSKPRLLITLLRRIRLKKVNVAASSYPTVSASSPCRWSPSYAEKRANRRRRMFSSWRSSFDESLAVKMIDRSDETSRVSLNMRFGTKQGDEEKIHRYSSTHVDVEEGFVGCCWAWI